MGFLEAAGNGFALTTLGGFLLEFLMYWRISMEVVMWVLQSWSKLVGFVVE